MARNSEIVRAGLGSRVDALTREGLSAAAIAKTISAESGKTFSNYMVYRSAQKNSPLSATVSPRKHADLDMMAAAIAGVSDQRDTETSSYYGINVIDTSNAFTEYYGIARGIKSGQVMRAFKNLALKITNGARIVGDEGDEDAIDNLTKTINFSSTLQDTVRSTCEMGTSVISLKSTDGEFITPQILPMRYLTLLTENETPGTIEEHLVHGDITQIILDESGDSELKYEREDVGLFRIWSGGNEFIDIKGRNTDGIYGESMTLGVGTPLKSLLNASFHYDAFIERYGLGQRHINLTLLADMLRDKKITVAAAQKTQDEDAAALQKIGANEDIVSMGREVQMIESKTGFDIIPYFVWREKQINRALLQSDVGAGDVGNSWTSAGTAVSAQDYDTYKSLRDTLFDTFFAEVVTPNALDQGLDPATLSIAATPYLRVDVPYQVLTEWADRGIITEGELRVRGGFAHVKPDDD